MPDSRRPALPFDPIDEAARQWGLRWDAVEQMHAVTSLMRVQQVVLAQLDELLRPHGLTFARYEALVLLTFSKNGSLPLGKMGERLQVHATSVTSIVDRLEAAGLLERLLHPHRRREVQLVLTGRGRHVLDEVDARRSQALAAVLAAMEPGERAALSGGLRAFLTAQSDTGTETGGPGR